MRRFRKLERRVFAALPLVAVALGWLAIWLAWPSMPTSGVHRPASATVTLCRLPMAVRDAFRRPMLFGRPSPFGFRPLEEKEAELSVLSHRLPLPSRLLEHNEAKMAAPTDVTFPGVEHARREYAPVFEPATPFPVFAPEKGFYVHVLGGLASRKLAFGEPSEPLDCRQSGSWEVDLVVRVTAEGRVRDILVQQTSADAETLRHVEQFVWMATAAAADADAVGRVRVGCAHL